jgi:hypothetical protein
MYHDVMTRKLAILFIELRVFSGFMGIRCFEPSVIEHISMHYEIIKTIQMPVSLVRKLLDVLEKQSSLGEAAWKKAAV